MGGFCLVVRGCVNNLATLPSVLIFIRKSQQIHTKGQIYRSTDIQTNIHIDLQTFEGTDILTEKHADGKTERRIDRLTNRHADGNT